jgi:hypothetical protein
MNVAVNWYHLFCQRWHFAISCGLRRTGPIFTKPSASFFGSIRKHQYMQAITSSTNQAPGDKNGSLKYPQQETNLKVFFFFLLSTWPRQNKTNRHFRRKWASFGQVSRDQCYDFGNVFPEKRRFLSQNRYWYFMIKSLNIITLAFNKKRHFISWNLVKIVNVTSTLAYSKIFLFNF